MILENIKNTDCIKTESPEKSIDEPPYNLYKVKPAVSSQPCPLQQHLLAHSPEGRPIWFYTANPASSFSATATVAPQTDWDTLFIGSFHGDEGLSTQLLERFMADYTAGLLLLKNAGGPFAVLPVLNPDGLDKNTRTNSHGVDLNRNWPTQNWSPQTGPELGRGTAYYEGPSPASEPETQALLALIEQYRPRKIVSLHTPYRVINYDGPAEGLAKAMSAHSGQPDSPYPVVESIGYSTPGSFGTYYGIERQIAVITLELPETDADGNAITLEQLWEENKGALLAALAYPTDCGL